MTYLALPHLLVWLSQQRLTGCAPATEEAPLAVGVFGTSSAPECTGDRQIPMPLSEASGLAALLPLPHDNQQSTSPDTLMVGTAFLTKQG